MSKVENSLADACIALIIMRGGFAWRNNTGAVKTQGRYIQYGHPGSPDVLGVFRGLAIGVECKRPVGPRGGTHGSEQSGPQARFQSLFSRPGADGIYILARNVGDVDDVLAGITK